MSQSSGAMTYSYPLTIPPGRNGMQPDLSFTYSSADKRQDSVFGYGWTLNLPYIERVNKLGTNNLYNQDRSRTFFTSSFSGELLPVLNTTPVGGSFLGASMETSPLPTLELSDNQNTSNTQTTPALISEGSSATISEVVQSVPSAVVHSFHTFTDTFLPVRAFHPKEEEEYVVLREKAAKDAKKPIPGFAVAEEKQTSRYFDPVELSSTSPHAVADLIKNADPLLRSSMKGEVMARIGKLLKTQRGVYAIEIVDIEPIDGGVEVFARVWDKNDQQIGFGKDGTVDIERFRIFNPPILVEDERGDIVHTWINPDTGEQHEAHFREDPEEALLQSLERTIDAKKERFNDTNIVQGKQGHTTNTFYSDTSDGWARSESPSWSTLRNGASEIGNTTDANTGDFRISDWYGGLVSYRFHGAFNTSALGSATISSASLNLYFSTLYAGNFTSHNGYQVSKSALTGATAAARWDSYTSAMDGIPLSSETRLGTTAGYVQFSLNSSGLNVINKTGTTNMGVVSYWDMVNADPNQSYGTYKADNGTLYMADTAGTTNDPMLVVESTGGGVGSALPGTLLLNGYTNPSNIATSSPYFSAIHTNSSTTALATSYQIQISTTTSFTSSLYWDSGQRTLSSSTPVNQRTPNIYSTTTFATNGVQYYWRIKLWDQTGTAGDWSTTTNYFIMQVAGDYMARIDDGSFIKYTLGIDGTWTAYDKKGWKYTFGASSNGRLSDPNSPSTVYRWYLEEVADPNGNKILYRYTKDGGQVYPYYIDYTDRQGGSLFDISFVKDFSDASGWPTAPFATSSIYGFPVFTRYLISDITISNAALGAGLIHRITPTYTVGDNGSRVLLSGVKEYAYGDGSGGFGGSTIALPPTTFKYQTSVTTWSLSTDQNSYQMPFDLFDVSNNDYGYRLFDVNGDGLPDWVKASSTTKEFRFNTGSAWGSASSTWNIPVSFTVNGLDQGVRMGDVNGDGLTDLIAASSSKVAYLNNGTNTWVASSSIIFPESFIDTQGRDAGVQIADVNGDGLSDILRAIYATSTGTTTKVYINNGFGWTQDTGWTIPEVFISEDSSGNRLDPGTRLYDYNGDGLIDIVRANTVSPGVKKVYVNSGRGWQLDPSVTLPEYFSDGSVIGDADYAVRFADVNGDDRVDMVKSMAGNTRIVYINKDGGHNSVAGTFPEDFEDTTHKNYSTQMVDVNGDGMTDVIRGYYTGTTSIRKIYLKNGDMPDLLKEVVNSNGGKTIAVYRASTQYRDQSGTIANPNLPLIVQTARTITTDNGTFLSAPQRVIATTTYDYQRGSYFSSASDPTSRQFGGFGLVIATTSADTIAKMYFHQGNGTDSANGEFGDHVSKIGKPYRTETSDVAGNLYARTINKWTRADYGDGRNFVKLAQTLTQTFDGNTSHRDTAASTTYNDITGDISVLVNYGEVSGNSDGTFTDVGTDLASTTYSYAASSTNSTMSLPSRQITVDQSGVVAKDSKWYYDGLSYGSVAAGNATKQEQLISGTRYASTTKIYDAYGNVATSTDALGRGTGFAYDGYSMYPTTVTNPLGQQRLMSYDYTSGKVATTTDENNQTIVTVLDVWDRPIVEKQPDFTTPTTLVTKTTYAYVVATTTPSSIFRRDYLSSATSSDVYTYSDGFGRMIQNKKEAESANGWVTKDTLYNILGLVGSESLPYFTATSSFATPTTTSALFVSTAYDPMGRVKTVANAVGTTTNVYDDWRLMTTDALGNKKDYYKDALGNLAQVIEYASLTSPATTTYAWNVLGKLTKITDAAGNIRNFTYDNLGQLLTSEDLHASGDSTFGTSSRQYDDMGNVTRVVTPRWHVLTYTYDVLNRILSEDVLTTSFTDVAYIYDTCANGKGRLCTVTANNAATTTRAYNPVGLVSTEAKQIENVWATTSTSYLRTGAVDAITYPDNHQIAYVYNDAGDLDRVLGLAPASTTWHALVERMSYAPTGQPTTLDYGNNTITTYTYDPAKLYRLTRKLTVSTSTIPALPEQLQFLDITLATETLDVIDPLSEVALVDPIPLLSEDGEFASTTAVTSPVSELADTERVVDGGSSSTTPIITDTPISLEEGTTTAFMLWTAMTEQILEEPQSTIETTDTSASIPMTEETMSGGDSTLQYLIVGGGGGGAGGVCGGGGAGGVLQGTTVLTPGTYSITVGAGGAQGNAEGIGYDGATSTAFSLSARGGGAGGYPGHSGGSGGGGCSGRTGGSGTSGQGYAGGSGYTPSPYSGAGGGGAGATGQNGGGSGGNGGIGIASSISGTSTYYAGGGAGGSYGQIGAHGGTGGLGGGGSTNQGDGGAGTPNTGGGGGGGGYNGNSKGGAGGSGIVIVRWATADLDANCTSGGGTLTGSGSDAICTFTTSGTFTILAPSTETIATTTLHDLRYEYDAVGNITSIIDLSGTNSAADTTYSYDGLYRLISASTTNATTSPYRQTYSYDALGNLTNKSDVGSYTYSGSGYQNPHAASSINGNSLMYDNAGNVTAYNGMTYVWDYLNRLTSTTKSGTSTSYLYDHTGQRVTESINKGSGTTTTIFWNKYYSTQGATSTLYLFLPDGTLLGTVEGNGNSTSTLIAHTDHLNSASVWSNATGAAQEVTSFYPFGEKRVDEKTGTAKASRQFIGEHQSDDVGMSYLNARWMGNHEGRFVSQDPVARDIGSMEKIPVYILVMGLNNGGMLDQTAVLSDPQMLNSYSYAVNNPITKSDPSGLWFKEFATGQQSWSSFQLELGEASIQMSQDSSAWNYALDHPYKSSVVVATLSTAAAVSGSYAVATAPSVVAPGVGTAYAVNRAIATAVLLGTTYSRLNTTNQVLGSANQVPTGSSLLSGTTQVTTSVVNQKVDSLKSGVNTVVNTTVNMASSAYQAVLNSIQAQINYIQTQINALAASMSKSTKK